MRPYQESMCITDHHFEISYKIDVTWLYPHGSELTIHQLVSRIYQAADNASNKDRQIVILTQLFKAAGRSPR